MKRELKVGDRGRVYGWDHRRIFHKGIVAKVVSTPTVGMDDYDATLSSFFNDGSLILKTESDGLEVIVHESQFRPFKEKKKPREFWVNVYKKTVCAYLKKEDADRYADPDRLECILVKEVIGK